MKVCVIGAGPAGLTTIKQLLDEGHDVTCFEKSSSLGGIWYRHERDENEMKAFDSLILTISIKLMSYSDFMPKGERVFYTHQQYFEYLQAYAERFGLRERIRFNTAVTEIRKTAEGAFCVTTASNGNQAEHEFEAVAICTGPFQSPNFDVRDLDKFEGEIVHSSQYRNSAPFRDKRVLIVGMAESGADVLREISEVASECTLSIRSYSVLTPRLIEGKYPTDTITVRALFYDHYPGFTKFVDGDRATRLAFSLCIKYGGAVHGVVDAVRSWLSERSGYAGNRNEGQGERDKLGQSSTPTKIDVDTLFNLENEQAIAAWNRRAMAGGYPPRAIFCKNVSFIPNIVNGKILVNDTGIDRIEGRRVHFHDKKSRDVDTIVLCTGFRKNFAALGSAVSVKDNNVRNLYKHAFYPEHQGRLALIGFVRPFSGGIPICAEMQARYFSLLCSGKLALPHNVHEVIRAEKAWEEMWTAHSPRHTEAIPSQVLFLDSLAKEIGCLMPLPELLKRPNLLIRHWIYPFNQACYRLHGPHSIFDAAFQEMISDKPGPNLLMVTTAPLLPKFLRRKLMRRRAAPARAAVTTS